MTKYDTFLTLFILSFVAAMVFLFFYIQSIFGFALNVNDVNNGHSNPLEVFGRIFNPQVIISGFVMGFLSLAYRIVGIVYVAKNKAAGDGEKALWIIGFIIMGFVTAIVFLVMAKGRKFV